MGNKPGKNPFNLLTKQVKNIYSDPWVWALLSLECNYAHFIREIFCCIVLKQCSPGKYLRDCCSQSRWQCCIQTDWEARASPAGGRGLLGASY